MVALHGLKAIVHGLFEQGEKLQLVLNRTPKMMDISTQELENILGRSIYAALPNDYMGLYQSYSSGNLLDSNNRLAQHFALLAAKIAGVSLQSLRRNLRCLVNNFMIATDALRNDLPPPKLPGPLGKTRDTSSPQYQELKFSIHRKLLDRINLEAVYAMPGDRVRPGDPPFYSQTGERGEDSTQPCRKGRA